MYGTSFINAKPASDSPTTVFSNMWRRYGLYDYDFHKGIEPVFSASPGTLTSWKRPARRASCKG